MQHKITPFLWFDKNAEEAARFYVSVFNNKKDSKKNSRLLNLANYDDASSKAADMPKGYVMVVNFTLDGQEFAALNGGPIFKFTEAISFQIDCHNQYDVDYFWEKLIEGGGEESMCGWLKDKYGVSWQVVPVVLNQMLTDKDTAKAKRAMEAMLKMKKLDIAKLQKAFEGK